MKAAVSVNNIFGDIQDFKFREVSPYGDGGPIDGTHGKTGMGTIVLPEATRSQFLTKSFTNVLTIGHGDLCFSNILYNYDLSIIKLIDVKGAMEEKELYMNPYYDIAKLSHSILGLYDFFNSDLYEIGVGEDLKLELRIDHNRTPYEGIFRKYLDKNGLDLSLVRLYEASLFLSMLPYHTDREKKVLGFVLNAAGILDELDKGI